MPQKLAPLMNSLRSWRDSRPSACALFRANGREREPRSREGIGISAGREKTRAKPACVSGEAAILPNSLAARSNSLAAPRFPLSAIRPKQSTRTRSRIPPATQATNEVITFYKSYICNRVVLLRLGPL